MKVLFVVTWYSSFDAEVIREGIFHYEQACSLNSCKDTKVAIYFPFDTSITSDFYTAEEKGVLVFRRRQTSNIVKRYVNYLKDYKRLKQDFGPDVIHAHVAGGAGLITLFWKKMFHVPYVVTEHAPIELMHLEQKKQSFVHNLVYKNSFTNICVSSDLSEKLKRFYPKYTFNVIYNGIYPPHNIIKQENIHVERKHNINFAIVAAFYDKDIKGFQYLLPAIKILKGQGKSICLHICGGGDYLDFYKNLSSELGITDNCVFYGQVEKAVVYSIVSQMDFVVSASLFESAGVSVEEAMLLGKPLVVTRSGGASSMVTDKTAIVVEPKSISALVDGINQMIMKISDFNPIEIKQYADSNFSMDFVTQKYIDVYKKIPKN